MVSTLQDHASIASYHRIGMLPVYLILCKVLHSALLRPPPVTIAFFVSFFFIFLSFPCLPFCVSVVRFCRFYVLLSASVFVLFFLLRFIFFFRFLSALKRHSFLLPWCPQWWSAYACFLFLPLFYYRGISATINTELLESVLRPRTALYCENNNNNNIEKILYG